MSWLSTVASRGRAGKKRIALPARRETISGNLVSKMTIIDALAVVASISGGMLVGLLFRKPFGRREADTEKNAAGANSKAPQRGPVTFEDRVLSYLILIFTLFTIFLLLGAWQAEDDRFSLILWHGSIAFLLVFLAPLIMAWKSRKDSPPSPNEDSRDS